MSDELAEAFDEVESPHDWDKAVSAAYLRLIGASQSAAANGAGIGERTLRRYEGCSWWPKAIAEADARWLHDLSAKARDSILKNLADDGKLALSVLERLDARLTPAKQRMDLRVDKLDQLSDEELAAIAAGDAPK